MFFLLMFCRDDDTGTTSDKCIHYAMVLNLVLHMLTQGDSFESPGPDFVGRYVAETRASFAEQIEFLWLFLLQATRFYSALHWQFGKAWKSKCEVTYVASKPQIWLRSNSE